MAVWIGLMILVTRRGRNRTASAIGLAILAPTVALASIDWVLARSPVWMSSLFGFAFAVSQLLAGLALAFIINLAQGEHPNAGRFRSLATALLSLALLSFWVWFVQFLIAWMGNLPEEARWYLARRPGSVILVAVSAASLLAAVVLLMPFRRSRWRLLAASSLILIHHGAHMIWLVRPGWRLDGDCLALVVPVVLGGLWLMWLVVGAGVCDRRRQAFDGKGNPGQLSRLERLV